MPAEARRDQLLDAALQIIARDGYRAVTIEAIAHELDVTRPVVYNVFDGLEALLHALLDRQEKRALDQLMRTISAAPPPGELGDYLRRTIEELVAMVAGDPLTWKPIFLAAVDTPPVVRSRIDRDREMVRSRIQALVDVAFARQKPGREIDAGIVSHALVAIGEYFGRQILQDPGSVDAQTLAATVTALFLPSDRRSVRAPQ
jgi:AcrR family transcriptional regulator